MNRPFTPETLAAFLEVERTMIYLAIRRKELRAFRVGGRLLRIRREDADQWWQSRCTLSEDTTRARDWHQRRGLSSCCRSHSANRKFQAALVH